MSAQDGWDEEAEQRAELARLRKLEQDQKLAKRFPEVPAERPWSPTAPEPSRKMVAAMMLQAMIASSAGGEKQDKARAAVSYTDRLFRALDGLPPEV